MGFKLALAISLMLFVFAFQKTQHASATINRQISFQGKIVLNSNGTNISNSPYNMQFKIYSGGDGVPGGGDETLLWTEEHLRNSSTGITITDGVFQVNLGAVTTLPGSVDFNNDTLWLSVNLGNTNATCTPFSACSGDGEMNPMVRFTAAPYALNSDLLDGLDSTAFGQLSGTNTWAGANTYNSQATFNTDVDYVFSGTENISVTSDLAGTVNVLSVVATPSSTAGTTQGLFVQQANSANTNGLDNALTIDNADTNLAITAALKIQNSGGGGYTTIIDNQGTLISGAELNLLDGHSSALVDTSTTGTIAITGTGILGAGSIASGFGAIDVGTDSITTTGTIGTAGSTTFTGNTGTFSGALAANGGITFDNSTDTLGAFTFGGNVDANTNILSNIGNAGTDFIASTGALTLAGILTANGGISVAANQDITTTAGTGTLTLNSTVTNASDNAFVITPSYTGGATDLLTYNGFSLTGFSPSNASGTDTVNGLNIGNLTDPGATITSTAFRAGTGWDTIFGGTTAGTNLFGFTNFTVTTGGVITATGLNAGSGTITTTGTIGTAGTTTFTGAGATFSSAVAANGGITFDNSTDTLGAHTLAGTLDANANILTNIGNSGTDFIASTGALTLAGVLTANGGVTLGANQDFTTTAGTGSLLLNSTLTNASDDTILITPSFTGGATDNLTYNGVSVAAFSPSNASGTDTVNGIKLGNLTDPGATITSNAFNIGSGWDTIFNNNGTLISSTELNLLDGHSVALVDTSYTGTLAITGTGILGAGSIASGFGAIDVGTDNITTTGTVFGNTFDRSTAGLLSIGTGGAGGATSLTVGSSSVTAMTFTTDNNAANDFTFTGGATFSSATTTGNITIQGGTATFGNNSTQAGSLVLFDGSGATSVTLTASGVGTGYSLTLPTAAGSTSQCLQTDSVTASQLVFGACGGGGGGDNITVNGSTATDANFLNTTASASVAGTTFAINTVSNPDDITLTISDASGTLAGIITANAQIIGGAKTFNGGIILAANQTISMTGGATGSRPGSPTDGMVFYDTTTNQLITYDSTLAKWKADHSGNTKIVAASNSSQAAKDAADYVADGDGGGAGDGDQVQINAALTAVSTNGPGSTNIGGTVFLAEGTYVADATILIPDNITLAGAGMGTNIELGDLDATENLIENSNTTTGTGIVIQDLRLDGRDDLNTAGTQYGIDLVNMGDSATQRQGARILRVHAEDFRQGAFNIQSTTDLTTVTDSTFSGNTINGINIGGNFNNITGNKIFGNGGSGMTVSGSSNNITGNSFFSNTATDIFSQVGANNSITGNSFAPVAIAISINSGSNIAISGNNILGGTTGVNIASSSNVLVSGNYIEGSTTTGINLSTSTRANIVGNIIRDTGGSANFNAISTLFGSGNVIRSNSLNDTSCTSSCSGIGISSTTSDTHLSDNIIAGPSTSFPAGVTDSSTTTVYEGQMSASQVLQSSSSLFKAKASGSIPGTGAIAATTAVTGTSTKFQSDLQEGDRITINSETRTILSITSDTALVVETAFTTTASSQTITRLPAAITVQNSSAVNELSIADTGTTTLVSILGQKTAATAGRALTFNSAQGNTSGAGGLLTLQAGQGGTTGVGGGLTLQSGAGGSTSGNSGAVTIATGGTTSGTAGNISVDVGSSSTSNGSILIGTAARTQTITIGNSTGGVITLGASSGSDLVLNDAQWSVTGAGAATFASVSTGSGTISTSGTIGTAGTTTFTGGNATFSGNVNLGSVGTSVPGSSVHIADTSNATNNQDVTIGSMAKVGNTVILQGGGAPTAITLQTAANGGIDIGVNNVTSKVINIGSVGTTTATTTVHIADSTAAQQTVIIGSNQTASATTLISGTGNINLTPGGGGDVVFSQGAGSSLQLTASAVPTADQLAITNAGQAVTTAGVNGFSINYVGGAAAVEAAGARIDLTPGGTSGGTWSGLRIVANATGPVSGVTSYGIKLEGPTSAGAGTETGIYIGTGWDTGLDVQSGGINLAGVTNGGNPSDLAAPAADNLRVYAKKVSGRMLLKFIGPSGVDSAFQPALFGNNVIMFTPGTGSTITANANGFGTSWVVGSGGGTKDTPTPATTAPAIANQIHRFRHRNVVTTTNQAMGVRANGTDAFQFWTGNAAGLGGFFFNTRFIVEAYPASTVRIFAGLASSGTEVVASDTVAGDVVGLWHDTTDASTRFSIVTRNNTTTTKGAITVSNAIAAGNVYDWFMYVKPNDTTVYYRLDDLKNGVTYEGNTATTMPRNTIFMAPQVEMSNGTANTTVNTSGIGVARIYIESDN